MCRLYDCIKQRHEPEHSCRLQLFHLDRYRRYPTERKLSPLLRTSILFRPRKSPRTQSRLESREDVYWWRRRALPPGPQRLFHKAFIAIAVSQRHHFKQRVHKLQHQIQKAIYILFLIRSARNTVY